MRRLISETTALLAQSLYVSGLTLAQISKQTGFTAAALCRLFRRNGLVTRKRGPIPDRGTSLSSSEEDSIVERYQAEYRSVTSLAAQFSVTAGVIRLVLKKRGVVIRTNWSSRRREDGSVVCGDCGIVLTTQNAHVDRHRKTGLFTRCAQCSRHYSRYKKYGLTRDDIARLLAAQHAACAICSTALVDETLRVDHCHQSGAVRGLLCDPCNTALGMAKDRRATLRNIALYLQRPTTGQPVLKTGSYRLGATTAEKHRFYTYGVTPEQFLLMKQQQGGVCACCGQFRTTRQAPDLVIEHCHVSQRIRGLTCQFCNRVIDLFHDDAALCLKAAEYLERDATCPG